MGPRHRAPSHSGEPSGPRDRRLGSRFVPGTIRGRLAVILAVPTALLVGVAAFGVIGQAAKARDASGTVRTVGLVLSTQGLIHDLQRERGLTSGLLGGQAAFRPRVYQQRTDSDAARSALDATLADAGSGATAQAVRTALERLGDLATIRGAVDAGRLARPDMLAFYTTAIDALNGACAVGPDVSGGDVSLRQGLESLRLLGNAKEATALERGTLNGVFAAGAFTSADYVAFTEVRATKLDALEEFARVATAQRQSDLQAAEGTPQAVQASSFEDRAIGGASGAPLHVDAVSWWNDMTKLVDDQRTVQLTIGGDARGRAEHDEAAAQRLLVGYTAGAGLAVAVAVLLWLSALSSILRPLRRLTEEARTTARHRLPDAIAAIQDAEEPQSVALPSPRSGVATRPFEFAAVATALEDVQTTAVRLAVEQAVMRRNTSESLANLARRSQNLVRRQLGFITTLENKETDPDQLADLFELDHLATRMRRTAESLLILVDEHSPRRWPDDIDVADVLRAAFADVEDYRRLVLRRTDDARVRGGAAAEVSHLIAELLDNALAFSPPDREVEIQARRADGEYHIAVVDAGVGMTADKIAEANARLRGERTFLAAPTRELGHFVVGRIAARLGVRVWLHDSPLTGVTARIVLPAELLAPPQASQNPVAASQGSDTGPAAVPTPAIPAPRFSTPAPPAESSSPTTRNGLAKRTAKTAEVPAELEARPASVPSPPASLAADRTPAEVRSMLNAFRAAVGPDPAADRS